MPAVVKWLVVVPLLLALAAGVILVISNTHEERRARAAVETAAMTEHASAAALRAWREASRSAAQAAIARVGPVVRIGPDDLDSFIYGDPSRLLVVCSARLGTVEIGFGGGEGVEVVSRYRGIGRDLPRFHFSSPAAEETIAAACEGALEAVASVRGATP